MRPRRDIDDLDNLFDREEAEKLRAERAEMIESGKAREAMLQQQEATIRENGRKAMLRATDVAIIREYEHAGVAPLKTNADGVPTCSLSLLMRMGWRVEDGGRGERVLVAPPPLPVWEGPQDWDSLPKKEKS